MQEGGGLMHSYTPGQTQAGSPGKQGPPPSSAGNLGWPAVQAIHHQWHAPSSSPRLKPPHRVPQHWCYVSRACVFRWQCVCLWPRLFSDTDTDTVTSQARGALGLCATAWVVRSWLAGVRCVTCCRTCRQPVSNVAPARMHVCCNGVACRLSCSMVYL